MDDRDIISSFSEEARLEFAALVRNGSDQATLDEARRRWKARFSRLSASVDSAIDDQYTTARLIATALKFPSGSVGHTAAETLLTEYEKGGTE